MKQMGVLELIQAHPQEIASVLDYLLQVKRDEAAISKAFLEYKITDPNQVYQPIENYLTDRELLHGAGSEEAFRGLIYQGVIPSSSDKFAGRGLYGVRFQDVEFAKKWSVDKGATADIVVALKLKASTKVIDITQGQGQRLFSEWKTTNGEDYDKFAQVFGADLLVYHYTDDLLPKSHAFILKNAAVIETKRGLFKQPRPMHEFEVALRKLGETWPANACAKDFSKVLPLLRDFLMTPLLKGERSRLLGFLPADLLRTLILKENREEVLRTIQWNGISSLLAFSLENTALYPLAEEFLVSLLRTSHQEQIYILAQIRNWPKAVWQLVPSILKSTDINTRYTMVWALSEQSYWPDTVWTCALDLLIDEFSVRYQMTEALRAKASWPDSFLKHLPKLMRNRYTREHLAPLLKERQIELPRQSSCLASLKSLALRFTSSLAKLRRSP